MKIFLTLFALCILFSLFGCKNEDEILVPLDDKSISEYVVNDQMGTRTVTGWVCKAPMPGIYWNTYDLTTSSTTSNYLVNIGDMVEKGEIIAIIETGGLVNEIESEYSGMVEVLYQSSGTHVVSGDYLVLIGITE